MHFCNLHFCNFGKMCEYILHIASLIISEKKALRKPGVYRHESGSFKA